APTTRPAVVEANADWRGFDHGACARPYDKSLWQELQLRGLLWLKPTPSAEDLVTPLVLVRTISHCGMNADYEACCD
ncbi:hypothetical protein V5799_022784, partial [Amblyomma americanum]